MAESNKISKIAVKLESLGYKSRGSEQMSTKLFSNWRSKDRSECTNGKTKVDVMCEGAYMDGFKNPGMTSLITFDGLVLSCNFTILVSWLIILATVFDKGI